MLFLVLLGAALPILGCTACGPDRAPFSAERVTPAAEVTLGRNETIEIAMGFVNESDQPILQQDDFAGQWVLVKGEGEVRARGRVLTAGPLEAKETSLPLVWSGALDSGRYTLKWGAPTMGTLTVEFTVFDEGAGVGVVRQETSDQFTIGQVNGPSE
jgi:hypothetical protein